MNLDGHLSFGEQPDTANKMTFTNEEVYRFNKELQGAFQDMLEFID